MSRSILLTVMRINLDGKSSLFATDCSLTKLRETNLATPQENDHWICLFVTAYMARIGAP